MDMESAAAVVGHMSTVFGLLQELPPELRLLVAGALSHHCDRINLCLALPPLGLAALRELESYQPLVRVPWSLRQQVADGAAIDEAFLRRYVALAAASYDDVIWLNEVAAKSAAATEGAVRWAVLVRPSRNAGRFFRVWILTADGSTRAYMRYDRNLGSSFHCKGQLGAERKVRQVLPDGSVFYYKGAQGAERRVREVWPDGRVLHYTGDRGAERMVRQVHPSGCVVHCKGEDGAERVVREARPDGYVVHYKGEAGAERLVRRVHPDGAVFHYKGEPHAERKVRAVRPDGYVLHYKGKQGAERVVRVTW